MRRIEATAEERRILKDYKNHAPHILMRAKASAVLLADAGVDTGVIAGFCDRKESTVAEWLRQWGRTRLASIYTGHAGNLNASKLTAAQLAEVKGVLGQPPSAQGLPAQFRAVPDLKAWLHARFEVVYESPASYHYLLRLAGLSFHQPAPFDRRRGPERQVEERMEQIRAEIAPALKDPDHLVYASDEVRVDQEAIVRRAWHERGAKTKLLVDRQRQAQSYIGFLDQNTGRCELVAVEWQNSQTIAAAVAQLVDAHPGKKITIVWDNASWHKSKHLRSLLEKGKPLERVHLIAMPPYAPDHNPIEHVWKDAKQNIANIQRHTFDLTTQAFEHHIANRTFHYHL